MATQNIFSVYLLCGLVAAVENALRQRHDRFRLKIKFYSSEVKTHKSQLLTIGTTALVTAAVTTFARNFISGEKKINHRISQRYGISDPQFERSMSQLWVA